MENVSSKLYNKHLTDAENKLIKKASRWLKVKQDKLPKEILNECIAEALEDIKSRYQIVEKNSDSLDDANYKKYISLKKQLEELEGWKQIRDDEGKLTGYDKKLICGAYCHGKAGKNTIREGTTPEQIAILDAIKEEEKELKDAEDIRRAEADMDADLNVKPEEAPEEK